MSFRSGLVRALLLGALSLWLASAVRAQTPEPTPTPRAADAQARPAESPDEADVDLAITAHVTARELRFEKVPNTSVEFSGRPRRETVWRAEREHLPAQVQPGVTYRDLGIRLRITSVFADIDRIVAEALGEVPPQDNDTQAAPAPAPTPSTAPAQSTVRRSAPPAPARQASARRVRRMR